MNKNDYQSYISFKKALFIQHNEKQKQKQKKETNYVCVIWSTTEKLKFRLIFAFCQVPIQFTFTNSIVFYTANHKTFSLTLGLFRCFCENSVLSIKYININDDIHQYTMTYILLHCIWPTRTISIFIHQPHLSFSPFVLFFFFFRFCFTVINNVPEYVSILLSLCLSVHTLEYLPQHAMNISKCISFYFPIEIG